MSLAGCASSMEPSGQLSMRAIEVRPIDAPYNVAFRAATHALFALGLTITHTEKEAGILTATRTEKNTGAKVGLILLFGVAGALADTSTQLNITMFLSPIDNNQTRLRIGVVEDDEVITDRVVVDRIWVLTQREALIESGERVPPDLEKQASKILSGEEDNDEKNDSDGEGY